MVKFNFNNFNGWIILDKQKGVTSRHAVTKISKVLGVNKIGHGGTLDPLATGVLPIAIGEATKLISFIQNKNKKYSFTIKWGESTDTDDIEGNFLEKSDVRPNKNQINKALSSFIGKIFQKPPSYSSIKINGKRSYNLARNNIVIEHKPRLIEVHDLKLKKIEKIFGIFENRFFWWSSTLSKFGLTRRTPPGLLAAACTVHPKRWFAEEEKIFSEFFCKKISCEPINHLRLLCIHTC